MKHKRLFLSLWLLPLVMACSPSSSSSDPSPIISSDPSSSEPTLSSDPASSPIPESSSNPESSSPSSDPSSESQSSSPSSEPSSSSESGDSSSEPTSSDPSSSESGALAKTKMKYDYYEYNKYYPYYAPTCVLSGSPKILVIPVWFSDSSDYVISETHREYVKEDIERAFFGDDTGWESVTSFFRKESGGILTFSGTVSSWYETEYSHIEANKEYETILKSASEWYFESNPSEDRKSYDIDNDGFLDMVSLIYACPNYDTLGESSLSSIWAFCSGLENAKGDVDKPIANRYFWASYDFMYGPNDAPARTGSRYYAGSTDGYHSSSSPVDAHTYIHEFGHALGLEDYYDTNHVYSPAGGLIMEDANVGGHDPYSVMAMGWADAYIPTESCSIEIGSFQTTRDIILLTPEWNENDSPFDEYLLLELYSAEGRNEQDAKYGYMDAGRMPSDVGIRLWHVDARLAVTDSDAKNVYGDLTTYPVAPTGRKLIVAAQNTYYIEGGSSNSNISVMGKDYSDYNHLQLIKNDEEAPLRPIGAFKGSDLFKSADTFYMSRYSSQFVKGDKLNNGLSLGWSFRVSIDESGDSPRATIVLTRE